MRYTRPTIVNTKKAISLIQGVEITKGEPTNHDGPPDFQMNTTPAYEADE